MPNRSTLSLICAAILLGQPTAYAEEDPLDLETLFELDVSQLMQIGVSGTASATPTIERLDPASVTTITQQMINDSETRSLFDLLEVYVPNFHYLPHHWEAKHMGMRGIMGDRDDKYLLLVNGRIMNERTHFGALSERDLPMMGDIHRIDVIRGPGSVVYGPGAVSMVINIRTENFNNYSGDQVIAKVGAVEEFQSVEIKKGIRLDETSGIYLYGGISNYKGADQSDSPVVYGLSDTTPWGDELVAGADSNLNHPRNNAQHRDLPKLKLHLNYQKENFDAWLRYTRGGEEMPWSHKVVLESPNGFAPADLQQEDLTTQSVGYQQLTLTMDYKDKIDDTLWVDYRFSADSFDYERKLFNTDLPDNPPENHREDEFLASVIASWLPLPDHALAIGGTASYERWGRESPGYPDADPVSFVLGEMPEWETYSYGLMIEHQWTINDQFTSFLGLRVDEDQYTDSMWSPRAALIYTPTDIDTVKLIASRSVRKNNAEELRLQHQGGENSDPEELKSIELVYQRQASGALLYSASAFFNDIEVIGIDTNTLRSDKVAEYRVGGLELELSYHTETWDIRASHSYTKLSSFDAEEGKSQKISAEPFGYGDDLSQWSNHISKLAASWQFDTALKFNGALRVFWDYQGSQDYIDYTVDQRAASEDGNSSSTALTDPGYTDSTDWAVFLDLGAHYQLAPQHSVSLQGYNLMGLFDDDFNKRLYVINVGNYRADAASFALNYRYDF
ncbi:hypothetical protein EZV61_09005 [Corallincola luteus]|uniref:TonB-dependent receptor plug domain-containing protein n=1 Tax=Corallincola luteus TaxID=1775177 RepID=A0ABY2AL69_9GAMM|nr:TonB-dependent receptor [Corallincola luteus]TCI03672.1 hypothetical protein EZV61_09005 [Corallincola luteus]